MPLETFLSLKLHTFQTLIYLRSREKLQNAITI